MLTIIDEEFEAAKIALGATARCAGSGFYHRPGKTGDVVLSQAADRSNMPALSATSLCLECWRPELLLVVGIAGGIASNDAYLGDIVVPDYLHYGEFRKITTGKDAARYFAYDHPSTVIRDSIARPVAAEPGWRATLANTIARPTETGDARTSPDVHTGPLVAAEKVMGDPDHHEQRRLSSAFPEALAIDMESVGVARAIHEARDSADWNPRLLVVRGISDLVHPASADDAIADPAMEADNNAQRKKWKAYAAAAAACYAVAVVDDYLEAR